MDVNGSMEINNKLKLQPQIKEEDLFFGKYD